MTGKRREKSAFDKLEDFYHTMLRLDKLSVQKIMSSSLSIRCDC
jgi:hypothetical protein